MRSLRRWKNDIPLARSVWQEERPACEKRNRRDFDHAGSSGMITYYFALNESGFYSSSSAGTSSSYSMESSHSSKPSDAASYSSSSSIFSNTGTPFSSWKR